MSGIVNKIKEAVHSDKSHHGAPEGTHGPHNSRVANAADPRVDSDRDGSHNMGMGTGTTGRTAGHGEFGSGTAGTANPFSGTHSTTHTGTGGVTSGMGLGHTHGTSEGTYGPHGSRLANAADPRVDSDRDGSRTAGTGTGTGMGMGTGTGNVGLGSTGHTSMGSGPHSSKVANAADPRVSSSQNTAGPHSSDMMNKMDPRVDSDLDGSKTLGGNKTFQ